jgi:excisionase family DNA binding protein
MTLGERLRSTNKALKVDALADLLGVAIRTIYKEVEDNRIPFFRVRGSIRFDPHQVADWLEDKMIPRSDSLHSRGSNNESPGHNRHTIP